MCVAFAALLLPARAAAAPLVPTALPAVPGSEVEPNDSPATATPIQSGERIRANLLAAGDVDYYSFSAQAGERVFANTVTAATAGSSANSELTLLSSQGETIEYDDNDGSQLATASSIAGARIPADGVYYLKVKDATAAAATEMPYYLYLQLRSGVPASESEPNNTFGTANPLTGGEVTGTHTPGDVDVFSMNLQEGDTVFLSLDLEPRRDGESFNGRLGFAPAGDASNPTVLTVENPSESTPPSEALTMTVAKSGIYYAYVDSANNAVGGPTASYDLSATVIPAAHPSCRTYSASGGPIVDGRGVSFPIEVGDAGRIGRAAVRLDLKAELMSDLDVSLRTPGLVELPLFTDIGSTTSSGPEHQEHLEAVFDEDAAVPSLYNSLRPLELQPERTSRLGWLEGEQASGSWEVIVRDDHEDGFAGSVKAAELILCPEAEEPEGLPVFSAGFESGEEGFVSSGVNDQWEWGMPNTLETHAEPPLAGLATCAEGAFCFKTDLDGPFAGSSSQDLVSPPISLAGRSGKIIASWEQWYQLDSVKSDRASVTVEEDGGGNPQTLWQWTGPEMTAQLGISAAGDEFPVAAGWGLHKADISAYAGKTIRLRFHLGSDATGDDLAGLAIDDVRISEQPTMRPPASEGVFGNGLQQPQASPAAAPALTGLAIAPRRFRAAKSGPTVLAGRPSSGGALVSYTDSSAAQTNVVISRVTPGRTAGGRCAAETKANATGKPCARLVKAIGFVRADVAGRNRFGFSGRVHGALLPPGEYQLQAKAYSSSGLVSAPAAATFTILAPAPSSR